ncbi:MAG: hypothetical protein QF486_03990 [Candidatus Woesearchaeota archaeon]|nr:hypothetical protein [Candidatus Woesearchaeota archaeon]MDP7198756.1 hypothetical protein [Candidatus Woesearchaeota archaeon]MDP7467244.1 hypothetical protein [Candidatus Woesearchaeota archaeon]MDP7647421.1 hypothetical protein [Candidatus Woesearchaeota archaeon]
MQEITLNSSEFRYDVLGMKGDAQREVGDVLSRLTVTYGEGVSLSVVVQGNVSNRRYEIWPVFSEMKDAAYASGTVKVDSGDRIVATLDGVEVTVHNSTPSDMENEFEDDGLLQVL